VVYPLNICRDFFLLVSRENQTTLPGTAACQISLTPAINNGMLTPKDKPLCSFYRTRRFSPGLASLPTTFLLPSVFFLRCKFFFAITFYPPSNFINVVFGRK